MPLVVSTDDVAREEQQEYWHSVLTDLYFGMTSVVPAPRHNGYNSRMERLAFGDLVVDRVRAEAHRIHRTARLARTSPSEAIQLSVLRSGRALVSQDDRTAVLTSPGDLVFVDTARPYVYEFFGRTEQVGLQVPREQLLARMPALQNLTAISVSGATGLGALASALVLAMPEHGEDRSDRLAHSTADSALELATSALQDRVGTRPEHPSPKELLLARAQQFLRDNMHDPELTPVDAAQAIAVSERYLFLLFQGIDNSPASWLRTERLDRAHRILQDPRHRHRSIQEVGASVGLPRATHFSRIFRQTFGVTATEHRTSGSTEL